MGTMQDIAPPLASEPVAKIVSQRVAGKVAAASDAVRRSSVPMTWVELTVPQISTSMGVFMISCIRLDDPPGCWRLLRMKMIKIDIAGARAASPESESAAAEPEVMTPFSQSFPKALS